MASHNFAASVKEVLALEGGWSHHPQDAGGPTNHGITLSTLQAWQPGATSEDLRTISLLTVRQIYRAEFWNVLHCDELAAGLDHMVFDHGVNAGPRRSAIQLQMACKMVGDQVDGVIGPKTLASVRHRQPEHLLGTLRDIHDQHYRSLPGFATFGQGWLARLARRYQHARSLT